MTDTPQATTTPPPDYTPPTVQPAYDPPVVVTLSMVAPTDVNLWDFRRNLIGLLRNVEAALKIPPEKSAIRTRSESRGTIMEAME